MKALSLTQPMAWAIFNGKDVENRTWPTKYRGPILIHASMKFNAEHLVWIRQNQEQLGLILPEYFIHSAIIGVVNIIECIQYFKGQSYINSRWFVGPYGFVLEGAREFKKQINYRGMLGLFNVPDELVAEALS